MANTKNIYNNEDRYKIEKANRIEALENIVENHTRTERHLERHADIASSQNLSNAIVKQVAREDNIGNLEDKIVNGGQRDSDQSETLEKNYTFAKGYIEHNKDHMDPLALKNMEERQQNRRDEMTELI
ncbi:hypothetical protein LGK95_07595 [Clostridium algoriphilum]|uniref:hypothetical protein n=1 Tax=Clostridium algoriphilum TaxID=198347 RepID=UPI001CF379DF|nr:hypothetical protein [Clostridium algoriphilum]MCB2293383.1 hypothetical protein [Clostridium algoriphilum]